VRHLLLYFEHLSSTSRNPSSLHTPPDPITPSPSASIAHVPETLAPTAPGLTANTIDPEPATTRQCKACTTLIISEPFGPDPDPFPDNSVLYTFLKLPRDEQINLIDRNFRYYNSLRDWCESLDKTPDEYPDVLPYKARLEEIVAEFPRQILWTLEQTINRNHQLREENNRLSSAAEPFHKCNHAPQIEELQRSLKLKEDEATALHQTNKKQKKALNQFCDIVPGTNNPRELKEHFENLRKELSAYRQEVEDLRVTILSVEYQAEESRKHALTAHEAEQRAVARAAFDFEDLQGKIKDWELVGKALLRSPYNKETGQPDPDAALLQAQQLVKALTASLGLHAMTGTGESSAGKQPTRDQQATSGMWPGGELTPEQCATLWNQIPVPFRVQRPTTPTNSVEMMEALAQVGCIHPHQLHITLGNLSNNDWDENLGLVEQLCEQARAPPPPPTVIQATGERLFKVSEIPEFSNTKEYERYRSQLQRFLRAHGSPQPHQFGQALERILQAFTADSAKVAAESWRVTDLIRPTWEETTTELLAALDEKFEDNNLLEEAQIKWYQTRLTAGADINEFLNHYEAAAEKYHLAQIRKNIPETARISPAVTTARLLQILPPYLRNHLKLRLAPMNRMAETMTVKELRPHLEDLWRYLPKPAATGHNTDRRFQTANARSTPANQNLSYVSSGPNKEVERQCGLICSYDTQPAVPQHLRGPLFPDPKDPKKSAENHRRRCACAEAEVCMYCRRPLSEHKASGPRFRKVLPPANTRHTPAITPAPLPESRQIEAPPAHPDMTPA
jgi:hypothetical protein